MILRLIKHFPKLVLVFGLIVGSSAAFGVWWYTYKARKAFENWPAPPVEDVRPKIARIEAAPNHLILVDNDLYDLDSGALIFAGWLKEGTPTALFYDARAKKVYARYERGFVRYGLDGKEEAALVQKTPPAFSDDLNWAVYAKTRDLWRADVNWGTMSFENERRLTTIEQFNEQYFAANILLGTDKVAILRNNNQLLRVNLESGDVKPVRIPLGEIGKRRSPNGRYLVGIERGQFYCYDSEEDEAKSVATGKTGFNDFQWLGNDRCAAIAAGRAVVLYDRPTHTISEVTALLSFCNLIGEPSPDGRYVFCAGARGIAFLVDLQKNTAAPVTGGAGVTWVSADTFAFSRELQDSDLRGTWLQTVGEGERRVSQDPYLVAKSGPMLMKPDLDTVFFATKHGLSKMRSDGTGVAEILMLPHTPTRVIGLQEWNR